MTSAIRFTPLEQPIPPGAPVITSAVPVTTKAHGNLLDISGGNFGAHADYNFAGYTWESATGPDAPINDTFTDWSTGVKLPPGWSNQGANADLSQWTIENGGPSQSGKYLHRAIAGVPNRLNYLTTDIDAPPGLLDPRKTLVAFHVNYQEDPGSGVAGKIIRYYSDVGDRNWYYNQHTNSVESAPGLRAAGQQLIDNDNFNPTYAGLDENVWAHLEFFYRDSESSTQDYYRAIADNYLLYRMDFTAGTTEHILNAYNNRIQLNLTDTYEGGAFFADLYYDHTWARVLLGNASTLAACTRLVYQIPTAWADDAIRIAINQGDLAAVPGSYLYVFDAEDQPNVNGFPI